MRAAAQHIGTMTLSWLAVVAASFFLVRLTPGDPVDVFLAHMNVRSGEAVVAAYRTAWGLDGSLLEQLQHWLWGFVRLDWGVSFETGAPVLGELAARLPWSAAIGVGGMLSASALGYGLGFLAALRPGELADRVSRGLAVAGQALPAFAVGLVLLWVLAAQLHWIRPFSGGTIERLLLPISLVAFFSIGSVSRLVRAGFSDVRAAPYFRTALAKGHTKHAALWLHGRRHAGLVLLAGFAPELAWIIGGTAVAEIVFGVPGLSERVVRAVGARDYAILQPYIALLALWIIVILRLSTVARRALDPRLSA